MRDFVFILLQALLLLLFTLVVLELSLQLAFPMLPRDLIDPMPQYLQRMGHRLVTAHGARQYPAGELIDSEITALSGDLYTLSCMTAENARPLKPYRVTFRRDQHGFRNDEPWPENADLVVIGDSFTAANSIQRPYWQGLSDSMISLGVSGTGTLEQQRIFKAFALPLQPKLVILAYFAGNDLQDTRFYHDMQQEGLTRHDLLHRKKSFYDYSIVFRLLQFISEATANATENICHYPMIARTDPPTPIAFYRSFFDMFAMDSDTLRQSEELRLTRTSISEMADALKPIDAELLLLYIPQKAEVYWNYLDESSKSTIIEVELRDPRITGVDVIDENLTAQRDVMRDLAAELGVAFLDMTPLLDEAALAGQSPYFFADTHWNQLGHDIARNALLDFLNRNKLDD